MKDKDSQLIWEGWEDRAAEAGKEFAMSGKPAFEKVPDDHPSILKSSSAYIIIDLYTGAIKDIPRDEAKDAVTGLEKVEGSEWTTWKGEE